MPRRFDTLVDIIWPRLSGKPKSPPEDDLGPEVSGWPVLEAAEEALRKRLDDAEERFRSVDARLVPLLALASIITTALTASVPLALSGSFDKVSRGEFVVVLVFVTYISLQALRSLYASVNGLRRRTYLNLSPSDLDPQANESAFDYRVRLLKVRRRCLWWNEWATNLKVDDMEVAHVALQNALRGVALLVVTTIGVAAVRNWG